MRIDNGDYSDYEAAESRAYPLGDSRFLKKVIGEINAP
jgi:hypothetical protein